MYTRTLRPSPIKHIYKFASHKNGNVQTVESSLEFNACIHFEYANEARSFVAVVFTSIWHKVPFNVT